MKPQILDFLKNRSIKLCALSTVNVQNKPESAVLAYSVFDDGSIIVSTKKNTRKSKNIETNPAVAIVIGWGFDEPAVQLEGIATIMDENDSEISEKKKFYLEEHAEAKAYMTSDTEFILIIPTWVRMTNLAMHPPSIEEETLG